MDNFSVSSTYRFAKADQLIIPCRLSCGGAPHCGRMGTLASPCISSNIEIDTIRIVVRIETKCSQSTYRSLLTRFSSYFRVIVPGCTELSRCSDTNIIVCGSIPYKTLWFAHDIGGYASPAAEESMRPTKRLVSTRWSLRMKVSSA